MARRFTLARLVRRELVFLALLAIVSAQAQRVRGEMRLEVRDPHGAAIAATAELSSQLNQLHRSFRIPSDGVYVAQELPFGIYRLTVNAKGFAASTKLIDIHSEVPVHVFVRLGLAPVKTEIEVSDSATLVDPARTATQYSVGRQSVAEHIAAQPGRDVSDLVAALPGWIYEANGVLHPRGSEYDVQYVEDGIPVTQNRSPAFAPAMDSDEVETMRVLTGGYPAEYGRKLGGVIEVTSAKDVPTGLHGFFDAGGGSFASVSGAAGLSYAWAKNRFVISGDGFRTDRYLDPPVLENFTNEGNTTGVSASYEHDFSDRTRLRFSVSHNSSRFMVPNYLIQQEAGQRQDLANIETGGQVFLQHILSPDLVFSLFGGVRDSTATLSSNQQSTPVIVAQDRGYREGYVRQDLAGHHGHHDWKVGVDGIFNPVHEQLHYTITDPRQFDPGTQPQFDFLASRWDIEPSAYVQDQIRLGNWNVSAGLRFDHYGFVVHESGWSPRVSVSRYVSSLGVLIHASYDRVFQTPTVENLQLASSPHLDSIHPVVLRLPVRPARANYYEVGITKAVMGKLRLDVNAFRRDFRNFSDDDVLLDTGISFPIAFAKAQISGEEVRLEVPRWGRFSGYVSYANQSGLGQGPITGGLFLGSEAADALTNRDKFAISQDQRNTAHARVRFQVSNRTWVALGGQYGSGLPAELEDLDPDLLLAQYGAAILHRVNLERGRVDPSFSLDAAAGVELYRKEQRSASLQVQTANLTDRINVINFASLFSGTAVASPRSVSGKFQVRF